MVIWIKLEKEIEDKWFRYFKKAFKDNPNLMTNPKKLTPEQQIIQATKGYTAQELVGNWLKKRLYPIKVEVNLEVGKDQFDTDTFRNKQDVKIKGFSIDVKTSKAVRKDFREYDYVIVAEPYFNPNLLGYDIKGYWIIKELEVTKINETYLKPINELKPITKLLNYLKWK